MWSENGNPYEVVFFASDSSMIIGGSDFAALCAQSQLYDLTGAGDAGAIISDGSITRLVQGSCDMNVRVGDNYDPIWSGTFNMGGGGNALYFEADGDIQSDGVLTLTGNPSAYTMTIEGTARGRGSLSSSWLEGNLTGPGGGAKPTGVVGNFNFDHSDGAYARGGFGADL